MSADITSTPSINTQIPLPPTNAPLASPVRSSPRRINSRKAAIPPMTPLEEKAEPSGGGPVLPAQPEYLQPAEFYPLSNHTGKTQVPPPRFDGFLSPEDDKLAMRGIPVFRPTLEDFVDFEGYVTKTVPWGQYSGIVKIIPPAEWKRSLPSIPAESLADVKIRSPIQQNMLGQAGLFRATNVEKNKNRPLSVKEWFEKCNNGKFKGPGPKDVDMTLDRDSAAVRTKRAEEAKETKRKKDVMREKRKAAMARKAERKAKQESGACSATRDEEMTETTTAATDQHEDDVDPTSLDLIEDSVPPLDPSSHHSPQSSTEESAKTPDSNHAALPDPAINETHDHPSDPVGDWYKNFNPNRAWLPNDTSPEDYTPEACANLERRFWKTMGLGEPGWYGADLQGTLFPDPDTPWNVAHLPNLLNRLGRELPGVNRPYLYFGMWRAAFAWHVEDMDLFSINYIHFGAPKFWYAIPQGQAEQFERTITSYFPREASQCDQFLRHKAYVMSPTRLAKDGIHVNMLVHNQGEFVITYPRGYHAGWNMGFNCAESVNFALDSWVELGRRAKVCKCVSHSVRIDMDELLGETTAREEQEEKMKTEQEIIDAFEAERARAPKRPRAGQIDRPRKRVKAGNEDIAKGVFNATDGSALPVASMEKKRKAIPPEKSTKAPEIARAPVPYPCVLCVNTSTEGLLNVFEPSSHVYSLCKSADGVPRAHEVCANSLPETWISEIEGGIGLEPVVAGVNDITKARWSLKCQSCTDKKLAGMGAKIQCIKGKCPRAFHVTCARDDEQVVYRVWEVEETVQPPNDSESVEPSVEKVQRIECLCPGHNPDVKEAKKAKAARELKERVLAIIPGEAVKVKASRGLFEVKLIRVCEGDQTAEVRYEDGQVSMVKWSELDFRPAPVHKPVENEYAREYNTTRDEEGKIVHLASASVNRRQALSVNQMLNHPTPKEERPIHSRVVVCDSEYRPPVPTQYAQPPPSFLTQTPAQAYGGWHPQHYSHGFAASSTTMPVQGYNGYSNNSYLPGPSYPSQPQHPSYALPHHFPAIQHANYPYVQAGQQHYIPQGYHQSGYPTQDPAATYQVHLPPMNGLSHQPPRRGSGSGSSYYPASQSPAQSRGAYNTQKALGNTPTHNGVGKIDLGLKRMESLMSLLPPLRVPAIHLAGTNGKGSVSAFLESTLRFAGLRVARYNSPHLIEPRDAIALDGRPPSHAEYTAAMERVSHLSSHHDIQATTFEIATAAAYDLIMQYRPDVMIIECGMGGVGDATNVIPPEYVLATGLTSVGLDHTAFLGETIEEITKVKAGIAVPGGIAIIAPQTYNGVARIARQVVEAKGSRCLIADRADVIEGARPIIDVRSADALPARWIRVPRVTGAGSIDSELGLAGEHQLDNVSVAINILSVLRADPRALALVRGLAHLTDDVIVAGIGSTRWKGRCAFHRIRDMPVLVDGAHNPDSAYTLKKFIDSVQIVPKNRKTWIISLSESKGKTPESVLEPMLSKGDSVYITGFSAVEGMPWVRPVSSEILQAAVRKITGRDAILRGKVGEVFGELERMAQEERGLVIVAGSLYVVADFYRLLG